MVAALYRRYRPETFAELIGQAQVTDPLRTALRTDRVGHAYLFSGPRGCGKTTSARILARCLNCAEGPTDTPCGVCPSCVELSRDGGGSLDVVEIDAASHNGVDDARDLRERAVFAPARDRFKIFILDEAHMVTPQGFNALLKIVEEPPPHVKFIFATTEPEKVIGTIRSRTHHYPFRLVPPAQLLDYLAELCAQEGVEVEPGVLPIVVRAGGGSVRDTLSLLDQLIAGTDGDVIGYARAVALLGYTPDALLDETIDALAARDGAALFTAVDRIVQTGQDPRRFVEDLLERLRDLIIVAASRGGADELFRGVPDDQLAAMRAQAGSFAPAELSRAADIANDALTEMGGATSPRLHLELLAARLLVALEGEPGVGAESPREAAVQAPAGARAGARVASGESVATAPVASSAPAAPTVAAPRGAEDIRAVWPRVLGALPADGIAARVAALADVRDFRDGVLALGFPTQRDIEAFRPESELLRDAIQSVVGIRVKFTAKADGQATGAVPTVPPPATAAPVASAPDRAGSTPSAAAAAPTSTVPAPDDWVVAQIPQSDPDATNAAPPTPAAAPAASTPAAPPAAAPMPTKTGPTRGEAVVRDLLGARYIEEQPLPTATDSPSGAPTESLDTGAIAFNGFDQSGLPGANSSTAGSDEPTADEIPAFDDEPAYDDYPPDDGWSEGR